MNSSITRAFDERQWYAGLLTTGSLANGPDQHDTHSCNTWMLSSIYKVVDSSDYPNFYEQMCMVFMLSLLR